MSRHTTTAVTSGTRIEITPAAEAYAVAGTGPSLVPIAVTAVTLREGELLVAVDLAGICESDIRAARTSGPHPQPRVLGHEQVGRVVGCGPGRPAMTVDGLPVGIGDRIVWGEHVGCGVCEACVCSGPDACSQPDVYGSAPVRRGWELSGGIATHVHLLARTVIVRARDWVPAEVLVPASCSTATAAAVIDTAAAVRPLAGEHMLVSGGGLLGLTAIAMACERGAVVTAVDADPAGRALARDFGATSALAPGRAPHGYGVAVEFSGSPGAVADLVSHAAPSGVIIWAGPGYEGSPPLAVPPAIADRDITVGAVGRYRAAHLREAVRFLERSDHELFARLIGQIAPLHDLTRAMSAAAGSRLRVAVRP